jgi:ABC-type transport system involved in multi-copper enzyme maturation permease subunit
MKFLASILGTARTLAHATVRDFRATLVSRRFIVVMTVVVLLLFLGDARLAGIAAVPPPTPSPAVWDRGADGSLVAFAFGLVPILLPALPIALGYDALERDRAGGYTETAMTRRSARWTVALGKFLGVLGAIGFGLLILLVAAILVTVGVVGRPVTAGFVLAFFAGMVFLVGLYLALVLLLSSFLPPTAAGGAAFLAWILFNAIRTGAIVITGQFALIVQISTPQVFVAGWADWGSFTGLYQGFLAHFVPESLRFVVRPEVQDLGGSLAFLSVPMGIAPWLVGLLVVYLWRRTRTPLAP